MPLLQRRMSGIGCSIDTSLYETALAWISYHAANYQASGELPKPQGSGVAMIAPYRGYATKDGFMMIAAGSDKLFAAFARVIGHPEWASDPRFKTGPDRRAHRDVLIPMIEAQLRGMHVPHVLRKPLSEDLITANLERV